MLYVESIVQAYFEERPREMTRLNVCYFVKLGVGAEAAVGNHKGSPLPT